MSKLKFVTSQIEGPTRWAEKNDGIKNVNKLKIYV